MSYSYKINLVKGGNCKKKGLALIINNVKFEKPTKKDQPMLKERKGSDKDAKNLAQLFTLL